MAVKNCINIPENNSSYPLRVRENKLEKHNKGTKQNVKKPKRCFESKMNLLIRVLL